MAIRKRKKKSIKRKVSKRTLKDKITNIAKVGSISLLEELKSRLNNPRTYRYYDIERIEREISKPASWFSAVASDENVAPSHIWYINKEKIYSNYGNRYWQYFDEHGDEKRIYSKPIPPANDISYIKPTEVLVLPTGRVITPIRQFCEFKVLPQGTREAFFYDFGAVSFPDVMEFGEPLIHQPTITSSRAEIVPQGTRIDISYQNLEETTVDIISASNRSFVLESVHDENREILNKCEEMIPLEGHWINGNNGNNISSDAELKPTDLLTIKGLVEAKRRIEAQGLDTSNAILYTSGKAIRDIVFDPDLDSYVGFSKPAVVTQGTVERITGIKMVRSSHIPRVSTVIDVEKPIPETYWQRFKRILLFRKRPTRIVNEETEVGYHSVLFIPNVAFGLVSGENLTMEAQRRHEIQSIVLTGTQKIAGVVKNKECVVRISHA